MRYIPNTKEEKGQMLKEIGVSSFDELIKVIPEDIKVKGDLNLPEPLTEEALKERVYRIAEKNADFFLFKPLVGAGAYRHYIPEAVKAITSREEFYSSYTPYQPEISQGNLQSAFEFQSHIAYLTGMDVVVPSLYDGASATAEAVLMAMRLTHKNKILISSLLHPDYKEVIRTYTAPHHTEIVEIPEENNLTDVNALNSMLTNDIAAVVVQSPNFFGGIEDVPILSGAVHSRDALFIQTIVEGISLGVLRAPAEMDVDIVAGESQSFGMDLNFGGPYNGYLATKTRFLRQLPGRIVGETKDRNGKRAFVMTMRAREQDIRREKATSNICSNHALNIVTANAYLSLMGKEGLYKVALLNAKGAHFLQRNLIETGKFEGENYPFFNEFVLKSKTDIDKIKDILISHHFVPPLSIEEFYPFHKNELLFAVTEVLSKEELENIAEVMK